MLHRRTYDTLSDTGTILYWELSTTGGLIVVQDEPSALTLWHEAWDETITEQVKYDLKHHGQPYSPESFKEAQDMAKSLVRQVVLT